MRQRKAFETDLGPGYDGVGIVCNDADDAERAIDGLRRLGCKNVARWPLAYGFLVTTCKEMKRMLHHRDGKTVRRQFSTKTKKLRRA